MCRYSNNIVRTLLDSTLANKIDYRENIIVYTITLQAMDSQGEVLHGFDSQGRPGCGSTSQSWRVRTVIIYSVSAGWAPDLVSYL